MTTYRWHISKAVDELKLSRYEWDQLNQLNENHILLDSRFITYLLEYFGSQKVYLAKYYNGTVWGICLIEKQYIGKWSTFQPSQSPLGLILLIPSNNTNRILSGLLKSLPGYPVQLDILQQDPDCSMHPKCTKDKRQRFVDYIQTSRMTIHGCFQDYWERRNRNLKHNLDRQLRNIQRKGQAVELKCIVEPENIAWGIREHGRMESEGWKGKIGTAISDSNPQGRFYRDVMRAFALNEEARIYLLKIDGRIVASDLCLTRNGMMVVLKTAYDESCKGFSPALLMRKQIMEKIYEEKTIKVVEFYGKVKPWHLQWTDEVRTMYHIEYTRNGAVAYLKQGIVKALKHGRSIF